ncbi:MULTISPECIES: O-antigen ligase family protein [Ramlibacter]|uniref:O-antigen ligase family protein n=1 Tax=Ramlibacter aquaticus TaxID=2780094 RepID=A0ABR9SEL1_9BURK|nr:MULTISPECIES: O-antigen ligase family protein [Ramlibacter]MBE7940794.1 O-antigen ligase family protein [Ramlibacter aquaticus]
MGRRRNASPVRAAAAAAAMPVPGLQVPPAAVVPTTAAALPAEAGSTGIALLLGLMILLAPALGVPNEEMLQDTLKSIVVAFFSLGAAVAFFWELRRQATPLRWHAGVWLPLLLCAYALGSMAWSQVYLAGVEAIRWFLFALIAWLTLNTFSRERMAGLALAVHAGAVVASTWAVLQFLVDFGFFPQGPNPASTFINRNFFAEFAVCTLPFSMLLLGRARRSGPAALLALSNGWVITAILMTGTRAALIALWLQLLVLWPLAAWLYRDRLGWRGWARPARWGVLGLLLATVLGLGSLPTGNPKIVEEGRGNTALARAFTRTASIRPGDESLGVRMVMWRATGRMIAARPLSGVGAGAWENDVPLYQPDDAQLETDYYVHNEFLQLVAEYGLVGWLFLAGLVAWLLRALRDTLRNQDEVARAEAPWRAVLLSSLLALFVVSNVGFAWRMASTGALFALCLGALAASDARMGLGGRLGAQALPWRPSRSLACAVAAALALALAAWISQQAAECERKLVRATRMALTITASGRPNDPQWAPMKTEMLRLVHEGVDINRHYRKITPIVADELARWGDWKDAIPLWESVISSRPYIVAIMTNIARGYLSEGQVDRAAEFLARAKAIHPEAPSVLSLEVLVLSRQGRDAEALARAREVMAQGVADFDLLNAVYLLSRKQGDLATAEKALQTRLARWPYQVLPGLLELAQLQAGPLGKPDAAVATWRQALARLPARERDRVLSQVPAALRPQVESQASLPDR